MSLEELEIEVNNAWAALRHAQFVNRGERAAVLRAEERYHHAERQYREAYRKLLEEAGQ